MKIEIGKTYLTRNGHKVRVICTDKKGSFPLIGLTQTGTYEDEKVIKLTKSGRYYYDDSESGLDLIREYSPWDDIEVDTPIYVRDSDDGDWLPRHFAKYKNGYVYAWVNSGTSFTTSSIGYASWQYAKLAENIK